MLIWPSNCIVKALYTLIIYMKHWLKLIINLFWLNLLPSVLLAQTDVVAGSSNNGFLCASCHGENGKGMVPNYGKLAGQNEKYLLKQMQAFASGQRNNLLMQTIATQLTAEETKDLAAFFAKQSFNPDFANRALANRGQLLYRHGANKSRLPACMACHGPAGEGNAMAGIPALAGQYAAYTTTQLLAYRSNIRKTDINHVMHDIAARLSDDDIAALASYLQGLHRT